MPLTPKQQRFIDEYLIDLNATQAAIRAGYSVETAKKKAAGWVVKGSVSQAIQAAREKVKQRNELSQDDVIQGLLLEAKRDGKGASHAARVSAWTQLGKHLGMFVERHEHSGPNGEPIQHEHSLTARIDELTAAFAGVADRAGEGGPPGDGAGEPVRP